LIVTARYRHKKLPTNALTIVGENPVYLTFVFKIYVNSRAICTCLL